ncbi:hypothetical protein POPTR_012G123450v4 [Populus trichocarpa]|uniref:Uncharacterized protein n=1 Tax=Populus trichocarpa TaxID=3694 RepID=A0ACC0S666_POPTR|nr:hypothetical protein POPTR_012G123450v4 [Populus trichocarpa]
MVLHFSVHGLSQVNMETKYNWIVKRIFSCTHWLVLGVRFSFQNLGKSLGCGTICHVHTRRKELD